MQLFLDQLVNGLTLGGIYAPFSLPSPDEGEGGDGGSTALSDPHLNPLPCEGEEIRRRHPPL